MNDLKLQCGDIICTRSDAWFGKAIRFIEKINATDNESVYNHVLIMKDEQNTFEALGTICSKNFYKEYVGKLVMVIRPLYKAGNQPISDSEKIFILQDLIRKYEGKWYPWYRLPLYLIPPLAKINIRKIPVCSELAAMFLWKLGIRHDHWAGTNPDTLADELRHWKNYGIICEKIC